MVTPESIISLEDISPGEYLTKDDILEIATWLDNQVLSHPAYRKLKAFVRARREEANESLIQGDYAPHDAYKQMGYILGIKETFEIIEGLVEALHNSPKPRTADGTPGNVGQGEESEEE